MEIINKLALEWKANPNDMTFAARARETIDKIPHKESESDPLHINVTAVYLTNLKMMCLEFDNVHAAYDADLTKIENQFTNADDRKIIKEFEQLSTLRIESKSIMRGVDL